MPHETDVLLTNMQYFFSTAPQVLGALLAITGAFALFKLEGMKKEMFAYLDLLIQFAGDGDKHRKDLFEKYFFTGTTRHFMTSILTQNHVQSTKLILKALHKMEEHSEEYFEDEDYNRLSWICGMFDINRMRIDEFKSQSKTLLVLNGITLAILLAFFLAIPNLAINYFSYISAMALGYTISCISLGYILFFVARSFEAKLLEGQKILGPFGMEGSAMISDEKIDYNISYHNDQPID